MKDTQIDRKSFVNTILNVIPPHLNAAEFLMDLLQISRVSVYRRLNGKIPFTYDEIVRLSYKLDFSIDEVLNLKLHDKADSMYQEQTEASYPEFFLNVLKLHYETFLKEINAKNRRAILVMNHVWTIYVLGSDHLLKFMYYKWFRQTSSVPVNIRFRDIQIPSEILIEREMICKQLEKLGNSTFIIDRLIFFNTIKEVQYYYRRQLIDKEDLLLIRDDMETIIRYTENQITNGTIEGVTQYFYLSYINIYSNNLYVEFDDKYKSFFYEYSIRPFDSANPHICQMHKRWLESLKKDSVLISASNEIFQMDFFNKQTEYLENLSEDKELIP